MILDNSFELILFGKSFKFLNSGGGADAIAQTVIVAVIPTAANIIFLEYIVKKEEFNGKWKYYYPIDLCAHVDYLVCALFESPSSGISVIASV